ncbi:hypothetical protein [Actinoplanes sp. NPDC049118]|uniref:hypothetical protein n=1 Tax=Actinoplanes sp. NPDC049118 TaxID=3155769 RepID=UPI0033C6C3E9
MPESPVVMVHGIWNLRAGRTREQAAADLAEAWRPRLAAGCQAAGLGHETTPRLVAAYYADVLDPLVQGDDDALDQLTPAEEEALLRWLIELGLPDELAQGSLTAPLRQGMDWLARRRGGESLTRVMTAVLREVYAYLTRPALRVRVRDVVAEAIDRHRPQVVVAHSLGSVVTYEALHAGGQQVDLLVTLGSPLGLPGSVFEGLDPEPVDGRGARPPGVGRWVNIADVGDVVAVPRRLGDRFPVDLHDEVNLGTVDFHTLGGYLSCAPTAAAIMAYAG